MNSQDSIKESDPRAERTWRALGEVAGHPIVAAWRDQARKVRTPQRRGWAIAAALVVALAGAWGYGVLHERAPQKQVYRTEQPITVGDGEIKTVSTARGKQRVILLTDGSQITLNTSSRARVHYSGALRGVQLLEGEALFDVAKDPRRPFVVAAADRQVVALGTAFGVRLDGTAVQVTLVEGSVAVDKVKLSPGQQLIAEARQTPIVRTVDTARATSWRDGWLVLNRDTVREAIKEVSRYTDEEIVCDDPRLMDLHVSGTFRTGEIEGFLNALAEIHPLTVERSRRGALRLVLRD